MRQEVIGLRRNIRLIKGILRAGFLKLRHNVGGPLLIILGNST
jgi:hypothetical protein